MYELAVVQSAVWCELERQRAENGTGGRAVCCSTKEVVLVLTTNCTLAMLIVVSCEWWLRNVSGACVSRMAVSVVRCVGRASRRSLDSSCTRCLDVRKGTMYRRQFPLS